MDPARRHATYADLVAAPEGMVAEILDGELITSPRPASPHAHAATILCSEVTTRFGRPPGGAGDPGGWWALFEPELHFEEDVLVPDIAAWRRSRMPKLENVAAFTLAPDWVCEVISPRTARVDRVQKMRIYARERVRHLWLVDPILRTLEVYRLEGARWIVASAHAGTEGVRAEPFAEIEIDLSRLWIESA